VVDRLGDADDWQAQLAELVRDRQRPIATDRHERVEPHLAEHLDDAARVFPRAFGGLNLRTDWIARVERAEDRAAPPRESGDVLRRQHLGAAELEEPVEAVLDADAFDPRVAR